VDGLTGFPDAIGAVFPKRKFSSVLSTWSGIHYALSPGKIGKLIVADLKKIYQSITVEEAEMELETFARTWDSHIHQSANPGVITGLT